MWNTANHYVPRISNVEPCHLESIVIARVKWRTLYHTRIPYKSKLLRELFSVHRYQRQLWVRSNDAGSPFPYHAMHISDKCRPSSFFSHSAHTKERQQKKKPNIVDKMSTSADWWFIKQNTSHGQWIKQWKYLSSKMCSMKNTLDWFFFLLSHQSILSVICCRSVCLLHARTVYWHPITVTIDKYPVISSFSQVSDAELFCMTTILSENGVGRHLF